MSESKGGLAESVERIFSELTKHLTDDEREAFWRGVGVALAMAVRALLRKYMEASSEEGPRIGEARG